ncbi:MAG: hypothetical protein AAF560_19170 [Acidobacteriota bacterium]
MKRSKSIWTATVVGMLTLAGAASAEAPKGETLPTPYTAEQIRDEWTRGFWLDTRVTTPEGTKSSRMEVVSWSEAQVEMREVPLSEVDGEMKPGEPGPTQTATWEQLRDHASFPQASAERQRETRKTELGELEGWVYRVKGPDGSTSEFFFADRYPGPPVSYGRAMEGKRMFRVEQFARSTHSDH